MSTSNIIPLTVVIPTLGGPSLLSCLQNLYAGSLLPSEVIVCLPPSVLAPRPLPPYPSLRFCNSPLVGQVHQRAYGLSLATYPFVMQLDDDIVLHSDALLHLFNALLSVKDSVVGPLFYDSFSGSDWHSLHSGLPRFLESVYQSLFHFLPWGVNRMGKVSLSSFCWGVDPTCISNDPFSVDWLAGGCTLTRRENVITSAPNLFHGKAYSEDLYFSFLRRGLGLNHLIIPDALAYTQRDKRPFRFKSIKSEFVTRLTVCRHMGCSSPLFVFGFLVDLMRTALYLLCVFFFRSLSTLYIRIFSRSFFRP